MKLNQFILVAFILLTSCAKPEFKIEKDELTGNTMCQVKEGKIKPVKGVTGGLIHLSHIQKNSKSNDKKVNLIFTYNLPGKRTVTDGNIIIFEIGSKLHTIKNVKTEGTQNTHVLNNGYYIGDTYIPNTTVSETTTMKQITTMPIELIEKLFISDKVFIHIRPENLVDMSSSITYELPKETIDLIKQLYDSCLKK